MLNILIKINLWLFAYHHHHHHLIKYCYNWKITLNCCFICKINFMDYFIWKYSVKCPYFASRISKHWKIVNNSSSYVLTVPVTIFLATKSFLSAHWPVVKRFQTRKIDIFFSEILTWAKVVLIAKGLLFPEKCWFAARIYVNGS